MTPPSNDNHVTKPVPNVAICDDKNKKSKFPTMTRNKQPALAKTHARKQADMAGNTRHRMQAMRETREEQARNATKDTSKSRIPR
jgi:hypothetical protein